LPGHRWNYAQSTTRAPDFRSNRSKATANVFSIAVLSYWRDSWIAALFVHLDGVIWTTYWCITPWNGAQIFGPGGCRQQHWNVGPMSGWKCNDYYYL